MATVNTTVALLFLVWTWRDAKGWTALFAAI